MDAELFAQILDFQLKFLGYAMPGTPMSLLNLPEAVTTAWNYMGGLFSNFIGIFADLTQIIHLLDFLPSPWITLFLIMLGLVVTLRIYAYFSDISVGGFKI